MVNFRRLAMLPALCLAALAAQVRAADPISYIPSDANTVVVIDVPKVFASPLAIREAWMAGHRSASRPHILQPGTTLLTLAARMETNSMDPQWAVAIISLDRPVSISNIAINENGIADEILGKSAVFSPRNAFFVALEPTTLGVACPGDRQWTTRWLGGKLTSKSGGLSPYLQQAAVKSNDAIVFAVDLENAASPVAVRKSIMARSFDVLGDPKIDLNALSQILAGVKGVCFRINAGEQLTGKCVITFSDDTTPLATVGKRLILDQLANAGMDIPDLKQWICNSDGKTLVCDGALSTDGLFRLLSLIQLPSASSDAPAAATTATPGTTASPGTTATPGTPAAPAAGAADPKLAASQAYFQSVSRILDNMPRGASLGDSAAWLRRDAKRIDQLPMLNVDPDLLAWGTNISAQFYDCANLLAVGQAQVTSAASIGSTESYYGGNGVQDRINYDNTVKQRTASAQAQRAASIAPATKIMSDALASRSKVRAQMVARYNAEF
jgi:hypothetical protein